MKEKMNLEFETKKNNKFVGCSLEIILFLLTNSVP